MKARIWLAAATLAASLAYGGAAMAQTTPSATPTPGACTISTLPDDSTPNCATGAEEPPAFLGVSGGNINNVASDKSGNYTCGTGTLGALVQDSSGNPYVLSTNHVLARNSATSKGSARANEALVQPGLQDLGCWQDTTATVAGLSKWVPLSFSKGTNAMDAAIGKVVSKDQNPGSNPVPGIDPLGRIFNVGQISTTPFNYDDLVIGLPVIKMGRTSCLTSGLIDSFDAMGAVVYPGGANAAASGTAFFDHQILVFGAALNSDSNTGCTFAEQGDSGSLVLTDDFTCPQAIGMVFAASSGTSYGPDAGGQIVAVTPIQTILDKFKVTLVGQQCTESSAPPPSSNTPPSFTTLGAPAHMSDAMRASVERMRQIKNAHAEHLLMHHAEIAAIGIGTGDDADSAALNVYLRDDSALIRSEVQKELQGAKINYKHLGRLNAL